MTRLLDARTSQNASIANSISIPITILSQPGLFGQIGLNVSGATGPIRTQLSGTVACQLPLLPAATTITLTIVRGTALTDPVVYSSSESLNINLLGPQLFTFTASDFNIPAPASGLLVYTAFIGSNLLGTVRVGPESFNGIAYSD
ncbi:hypothetical protein ABWK29_22960 [Priestia megaterium]|jgi:hypothetical protein|uniref:hypothetical protein n=1 Tax=Priestia TaxID=2800373 RepID=UPI000BF481C0|nr:hypothetical protein [Priestia megaterium]RFB33581.1 hypothetical protein DZB86_26385 [Bacillus sp. RC]MBW0933417.1 hypothetical protein [Priestia megaterium]MCR8866508.1 hypothetical protein [Priestia megaterium]MDC7783685.1 hypothetical protein [Priestia megaterium]MDR0132659.1 hypothetical protein [Priestia megaterium]